MQLITALKEHKPIVGHLMQLYMYDFSEFVDLDVDEDGLYPEYKNLDDYWTGDANRFPYLVHLNGKHAGFVLVRFITDADRSYFSIAEFFVLKKYRRQGMGKEVAMQVFDLHKGEWEVFQKENNVPAQLFWRNVIDQYTAGNFTEHHREGKIIQRFKNGLQEH